MGDRYIVYFSKDNCKKLYPVWGAVMGAAIFVVIYGVKILNPFYTDWLLCTGKFDDLSQHYLGWEFYRKGLWKFPIGLTDELAYPIKTSVIFTDSIPIAAVIFKGLKRFLPQYFQYFGVWGILCFSLQGYFATKIFNELDMNWYGTLIGDVFLVTSPTVLYRMFMHTALGTQWLVLVAIYLFLRQDYYSQKESITYWGVLGFLTAGIHLYFFPMCFLYVLGYAIKRIMDARKIEISYFFQVVAYILGAYATLYILGGFTSKAFAGRSGFAEDSFNLNSFFNPMDFSCILPELDSVSAYQHEGFAYLGLGMLCMILIWIIKVIVEMNVKKQQRLSKCVDIKNGILVCIGIIYTLIAVSPVITFGDRSLIQIPVPNIISRLWSVFRATGRFIWPVWYMIAIYSIRNLCTIKFVKRFVCEGVIAVCLGIQLFDISPALAERHETFREDFVYEYNNDEFWRQLNEFREFKHLCVCNPHLNNETYNELAALALRYELTMNAFGFARSIDGIWDNQTILEREPPRSDSIYILLEDQYDLLKSCEHNLKYYNIGEFVIGITWLDDEGNVNDFEFVGTEYNIMAGETEHLCYNNRQRLWYKENNYM